MNRPHPARHDQTARPITVAMLTYRRPDDLAVAIPRVLAQSGDVDPAASLLVVDNDPEASAAEAVGAFGDPRVRYVHEPRPGIAAARNRALDEVPDTDLLVFIDDDERPHAGWLRTLVATHRATDAAAVVGPVVSAFDGEPDAWIRAGRFFDRRRLPTGSPVVVAATNNLLLDMTQVRRLGLRFDEAFGISGGSDTLFSRQLVARGGAMVWCDEAVVTDQVPTGRLTRAWVTRRAFRSGNSWVRTSVTIAPTRLGRLRARATGLAAGLVRIAGGAARLGAGVVLRSMRLRATGSRTLHRGAGMAAAAAGYVFHEYRRPTAVHALAAARS